MLTPLIVPHIRLVREAHSVEGALIVYRGMPNYFMRAVAAEFLTLTPLEDLYDSDGNIRLEHLAAHSNALARQALTLKTGDIAIATSEEATAVTEVLKDLSVIEVPIVIYENSLVKKPLFKATACPVDIDSSVEHDAPASAETLFERFYAYSETVGGLFVVSPRLPQVDESESKMAQVDFFNGLLAPLPTPIESDEHQEQDCLATVEDPAYARLLYSTFEPSPSLNSEYAVRLLTHASCHRDIPREVLLLAAVLSLNGTQMRLLPAKRTYAPEGRPELTDFLLRYWHSDSYRALSFYDDPDISPTKRVTTQAEIIEEVIEQAEKAAGNEPFSDVFLTAPTGAGKSVLFQIPALYLAEKYGAVTLVVSPLKALMFDQVMGLRQRGVTEAAFINSDVTLAERERIIEGLQSGNISILYLSPELLLSYDVRTFIGTRQLGLLVVDEAHLVTTWGRDFRIDYWYLGTYVKRMRKYLGQPFPVFAVTATAVYQGSDDVVGETIRSLHMVSPITHLGSARRDDIHFEVRPFRSKGNHELMKIGATTREVISMIGSGTKSIVYFPWTNQIEMVLGELSEQCRGSVGKYYGDVEPERKRMVAEDFGAARITVVLATKAFGMGIDVSDIAVIYHHAPQGTLADYIQEVGRVARDPRLLGIARTDFDPKDLKFTRVLHGLSSIKQYQAKYALQKLAELYRKHQERQMLLAVEDFAFIFGGADRDDLETKVKSTLLLLERDLAERVNNRYSVIIVRPKSMFATVYACVPDSVQARFISSYGAVARLVAGKDQNQRQDTGTVVVSDVGDIYEIKLDRLWERSFPHLTFPQAKRAFFTGTLFQDLPEHPAPRVHLLLELKKPANKVREDILWYFSELAQAFQMLGRGTTFSAQQLTAQLRKGLKDELLARRITTLVTNLYASGFQTGEYGAPMLSNRTAFLEEKRGDGGEPIFRFRSAEFGAARAFVLRKFDLMFEQNDRAFDRYISAQGTAAEFRLTIAYIIEAFGLGAYELAGGSLSRIFVRFNDPYRLLRLAAQEQYTNSLIADIQHRHERAMSQMQKFFESDWSDPERWDYIERYFLGRLDDQESKI